MRSVIRSAIRPVSRLALVAALALFTIAALQPAFGSNAYAAADEVPAKAQMQVAPQAEPDEGGTGVNNFDREEWYEFSILLAPFIVLVTFILILMFGWDRFTNNED